MPIYEFKCLTCDDFFELLLMNNDEIVELKCPRCDSEDFERVISTASYSMSSGGSQKNQQASSQTRTCLSGSCTTYNIPGPDG